MCDTYVSLGINSKDGNVIFGKNSVDKIISKNSISKNEFNTLMVEINNYSWEQAEELIK